MRRMVLLSCVLLMASTLIAEPEYLPGGPLAGLKLPLLQGDHGEPAGHPGSVPSLAAEAGGGKFTPQDQGPMYQLYPGSVELWRSYMHKYMPIRSFFDQQSQLKRWTAPNLPNAKDSEQYAAPLYWVARHSYGVSGTKTDLNWNAVDIVRTRVKAPIYKLDLGTLPVGLYCVRLVAAVETDYLQQLRLPAIIAMKVNDQFTGESTTYRVRISYVDEFYSVAELYFHAPEKRAYTAELWLDEGSKVDLLVRDIILDDALAGTDRRAIKTKPILFEPPSETKPATITGDDRLSRDESIWNLFPPINAQGGGSRDRNTANPHIAFTTENIQFGADEKPEQDIVEEHGKWEVAAFGRNSFSNDESFGDVWLVNKKLNLTYTAQDFKSGKPLPDPYPYKDAGLGIVTELTESAGKQGQVHCPIADAVDRTRLSFYRIAERGSRDWTKSGNTDSAHDASVALIRFAYQFPAIDTANMLPAVLSVPGLRNMDSRSRKRATAAFWFPHYANYKNLPDIYDRLFTYIDGNEELAKSVSRFVPWVENSRDLIKLLDVYLIQNNAKRQMRYHYHTGPYGVLRCAAVLGEERAARPMIDWTFASAWKYPLNPAGVQNVMIVSHDRTGRSFVGSWYYATAAWQTVEELMPFKKMGLLPPEYDVSDPNRYPQTIASLYWPIESVIAGRDFPRIADVGGPDKRPWLHIKPKLLDSVQTGWRATGDPVFAKAIVELGLEKQFKEYDWQKITKASEALPRAPWLENRSRQVYNWFGALEAGHESDSYRDRRAAYLRTGVGYGHHHADALDLQLSAFGLPMTVDGGQRPAYSTPSDKSNIVHNVVGVNGISGHSQSWVRHIADAPGVRHLSADAATNSNVSRYRRSIALIDANAKPWPTSYVVDFFKVRGGSAHTYQFHGPLSDEFTSNLDLQPVNADSAEGTPLTAFKNSQDSWRAGSAKDNMQATWRYAVEVEGVGSGEKEMLGHDYNKEGEPRKYTRLHLTGMADAHAYLADAVCNRWKYTLQQFMVRKPDNQTDSMFAAVIEPYVEQPIIREVKRIAINDKTDDPNAAALHVTLIDGRQDWIANAETINQPYTAGPITMTGEFAIVSRDETGLQRALLVRGTQLTTDGVQIQIDHAEVTATIQDINYQTRTLTLNRALPPSAAGQVIEINCGKRTTSATIKAVKGNQIEMKLGATYFRSMIQDIDQQNGRITCKLSPVLGRMAGLTHDFTASNDDSSKQWRAEYAGNGTWALSATDGSFANLSPDAFKPSDALRIWEYGKGDSLRLSSWVGIQRTDTGWELTGNADCKVTLPDGNTQTLTALQFAENNGRIVVER